MKNANITTHEDGSIQLSNLQAHTVWMPTSTVINGIQMAYETKIGEAKIYIAYDAEDKELPFGVLSTFGKCFKKWTSEENLHMVMLEAEEWAFAQTGGISNNDWKNASDEDREEMGRQSVAGARRYAGIQE